MPRWDPTEEQIDLIASTPVDEICMAPLWGISTMSLPTTTLTDAAKTMHRALLYLELEPAGRDGVAYGDAHGLIFETLLWLEYQITGLDPTMHHIVKGYPTRDRYLNAG